ncbi:unnamed protein product [Microthlaspi erraticum]|nr:unnamed protein product [Microthlaspi erraticum]
MLSRWFESRRGTIKKMAGDIPKEVDKELLKQLEMSRGLPVLSLGGWNFEVISASGAHRLVSLDGKTCSCREFQTLRIPCRHAMAAATSCNLSYKTLVDVIHKKPKWTATLEGIILPLLDPDDLVLPTDVVDAPITHHPRLKRPFGRPPKKRKFSEGEYPGAVKKKRPNKCGTCGIAGHNRVTCKSPLK